MMIRPRPALATGAQEAKSPLFRSGRCSSPRTTPGIAVLAYTLPMSARVLAPILETARLRLRGHGLDDFPQSATMWADPKVVRYIRPTPFTEEETWARLLRYVGHWALLGDGFWVVEDKNTGEF